MSESNEKSEISTQEQQEPVKSPIKRGRKPLIKPTIENLGEMIEKLNTAPMTATEVNESMSAFYSKPLPINVEPIDQIVDILEDATAMLNEAPCKSEMAYVDGDIVSVKEVQLYDRIAQLEKVVVKLSSIMGMSHLTKSMREEI